MSSSGGGSTGTAATNVPPSPTATKPKKNKKKAGAKAKVANGDAATSANGHKDDVKAGSAEQDKGGDGVEDDDDTDKAPESEQNGTPSASKPADKIDTTTSTADLPLRSPKQTRSRAGTATTKKDEPSSNHVDDRASQEEAKRLRMELEEARSQHAAELETKRKEAEQAQAEKEQADSNYKTLLARVNTIKSQLGERLKEDAEELSQCRSRIEELEAENAQLKKQDESRASELAQLAEENEAQAKELSGLHDRSTTSGQQWEKERDSLQRERDDWQKREAYAREEFDSAKQAMQDWEILAMEERSIRENLGEKVADLEEQLATHREAREKLESERQGQDVTVDGLQRALQELQEARKKELRELAENSQSQLEGLRKELEEAQAQASSATSQQQKTQSELERLLPLEAEVKEKTLLIGKLRHQAVGLNDHLTKALRQISRKGKPEDNIDRELVTNHLLKFLNLERSDPKKFEVLQIIASILLWNDEQLERAGLSRPGTSNPNLRAPISPWHRTPSTPSLAAVADLDGRGRQDSVGSAFAEFLEKESEAGTRSHSRETSVSERK